MYNQPFQKFYLQSKVIRIILVFVVFSLVLLSCQKGSDKNPAGPDKNNDELVINDQTVSIESDDFSSDLVTMDDNQLLVKGNSSFVGNLKEGSIIVSDYGEGIFRYVEHMDTIGGNVVIDTRPAKLDEVILQGAIEYKATITPDMLQGFSASDTSIHFSKMGDGTVTVSFGNWKVGARNDISIDASTDFSSPVVTFNMIFNNGIQYVEAILEINNTTIVNTEVTKGIVGGWVLKPEWAKFNLPRIPTPVPLLWITPRLQFYVGVDVSINGSFEYTITAETNVQAGILYEDNHISTIS
ncbi:hypothetical protein JW979_04605, partial [bacterium]|nr:hypothetical protein [candidate division CSSED10-310 bacterium]